MRRGIHGEQFISSIPDREIRMDKRVLSVPCSSSYMPLGSRSCLRRTITPHSEPEYQSSAHELDRADKDSSKLPLVVAR